MFSWGWRSSMTYQSSLEWLFHICWWCQGKQIHNYLMFISDYLQLKTSSGSTYACVCPWPWREPPDHFRSTEKMERNEASAPGDKTDWWIRANGKKIKICSVEVYLISFNRLVNRYFFFLNKSIACLKLHFSNTFFFLLFCTSLCLMIHKHSGCKMSLIDSYLTLILHWIISLLKYLSHIFTLLFS